MVLRVRHRQRGADNPVTFGPLNLWLVQGTLARHTAVPEKSAG